MTWQVVSWPWCDIEGGGRRRPRNIFLLLLGPVQLKMSSSGQTNPCVRPPPSQKKRIKRWKEKDNSKVVGGDLVFSFYWVLRASTDLGGQFQWPWSGWPHIFILSAWRNSKPLAAIYTYLYMVLSLVVPRLKEFSKDHQSLDRGVTGTPRNIKRLLW